MKLFSFTSFKKLVTIVLIVAIAVPASYLAYPKKAHADISACAAAFFEALGITTVQDFAGQLTGIRVLDAGKSYTAMVDSGNANKDFIKDCIEHGIALSIANIILDQMTQQLVEYINSGFQGSPGFVSNPGLFFTNIGDEVVGDVIKGSPLAFLCSPFKIEIQLALSLNFGYGYEASFNHQVDCTLSKVINNVQNAYNDFVSGGWGVFLDIKNSNNNPYGSFIEDDIHINSQVSNVVNLNLAELNWGQGFFSLKDCTDPESGKHYVKPGGSAGAGSVTVVGSKTSVSATPEVDGNCQTTSPGKIIGGAVENQLGIPPGQLALADDLDKVFFALANQMIKMGLSSLGLGNGGLFGASAPNAKYGGKSLAQSLTDQASNNNKLAVQNGNNYGGKLSGINSTNNDTASKSYNKNNIALSQTASSSKIYTYTVNGVLTSYEASRAVDGIIQSNDAGSIFSGSIAKQLSPTQPAWIEVDLGQTYDDIGVINIYERTNAAGSVVDSAKTYQIQILDESHNTTTPVWVSPTLNQTFNGEKTVMAPPHTSGRYVRIQALDTRNGKGYLQIAELQVYQNNPPTITLKGTNPVLLTVGDTYSEAGYTAIANTGEDISSAVTTSYKFAPPGTATSPSPKANPVSGISNTLPGTYTIIYSVTDATTTLAASSTRTVVFADQQPVIVLNGDLELTVALNSGKYQDPGVQAVQGSKDPAALSKVVVTGVSDVDTTKVGTYYITYSLVDGNGKVAQPVTRTVTVQ